MVRQFENQPVQGLVAYGGIRTVGAVANPNMLGAKYSIFFVYTHNAYFRDKLRLCHASMGKGAAKDKTEKKSHGNVSL